MRRLKARGYRYLPITLTGFAGFTYAGVALGIALGVSSTKIDQSKYNQDLLNKLHVPIVQEPILNTVYEIFYKSVSNGLTLSALNTLLFNDGIQPVQITGVGSDEINVSFAKEKYELPSPNPDTLSLTFKLGSGADIATVDHTIELIVKTRSDSEATLDNQRILKEIIKEFPDYSPGTMTSSVSVLADFWAYDKYLRNHHKLKLDDINTMLTSRGGVKKLYTDSNLNKIVRVSTPLNTMMLLPYVRVSQLNGINSHKLELGTGQRRASVDFSFEVSVNDIRSYDLSFDAASKNLNKYFLKNFAKPTEPVTFVWHHVINAQSYLKLFKTPSREGADLIGAIKMMFTENVLQDDKLQLNGCEYNFNLDDLKKYYSIEMIGIKQNTTQQPQHLPLGANRENYGISLNLRLSGKDSSGNESGIKYILISILVRAENSQAEIDAVKEINKIAALTTSALQAI